MAGRAIIGKIPGYNSNIDQGGIFEQELKKGITYVDFYPTSFTDSLGLADAVKSGNLSNMSFFGEYLDKLFTTPGLVISDPPGKDSNQSTSATTGDPSYEKFKGVLERMSKAFDLDPDFATVTSLRLVAANDSTFTETFTNSFDQENVIVSGFNWAKNKANQVPLLSGFFKGVRSMDYNAMSDLVGGVSTGVTEGTGSSLLGELASGVALGLNIAAPQLWSASQYNSTLTMFIKLVSPTGQEECIRRNIMEPILYLLAAASPITSYGTVYGYPLMWQVNAQGITNFRIGSIAALSIMKGSFETTFTEALRPTIVDVRLTIIPLLTDFAVQTNAAGDQHSIYTDDAAKHLGVQNPADIVRGTMNKGPVGGSTRTQDSPNIVSVKI